MGPARPFHPTLVVSADPFPDIDGSSGAVRALKADMLCVARDPDVTALIVGETGTGKERVARAIHRLSPRGHAPFVAVDCAGLSATLAEDTLFGHVRGAFTGAIAERAGPFERAAGGTILLDEIGDLPLELQIKLLRALQSRTVQRLGARQETAFDVRIMAATHVDLAGAVARGRFRDDLYYRLNVYEIVVPALRRRGAGDVAELAAAILRRLAARRGRAAPALEPDVMAWLNEHPWPGNVRELENVLERMLVAAGGESVLRARHLPARTAAMTSTSSPRAAPPTKDRVVEALRRNGFRAGCTAVDLGLSRHQVYRLVRRYGIREGPRDR